jgi:pimeloyl-ACP methyl ester carboxylesterase
VNAPASGGAADIAVYTRRGAGPTILWVHGYTLAASIWEPLWDRLPDFAHIALDLPGHGASTRPISQAARLSDFSQAVAEVADLHGADIVIGLSFGATVALQAGLERPTRYAALLLAACGLAGGPQDREAADCHLDLVRLARARGVGPWLADRWLSCPPKIFEAIRAKPDAFAPVEAVVRRHAWTELTQENMASMARDIQSLAAIARLEMPLALLVGEHDMEAFKRSAHLICKAAKRASCSYAALAGHLPLLEEPDEGAAWIRAQLAAMAPVARTSR